jgi:hypothetical protein
LFHAIAEALKQSPSYHSTSHVHIRASVVEFLREHAHLFRAFNIDDAYIARMSSNGAWGGEPEMIAISNIFKRSVEVYMFDPNGRATHVRTYMPVLGTEIAHPFRLSLLPLSGKLSDVPNHFSLLQPVSTVLDATALLAPVPPPVEIDLTDDVEYDDLVNPAPAPASAPAPAPAPTPAPVAPTPAPTPAPTTPVRRTYYKLYEHYCHNQGMHPLEADLAARAEVAWYACKCGKSCRKAPFANQAYERVVLDHEPVDRECQVWKPWSMYHTVVRVKLGRV